ncbi:MAG TPA: ABC transporter permease subunit [Trueperaceae bacterium]|nr:ABC transporter permease subunit [Trueperaceae bacterium]
MAQRARRWLRSALPVLVVLAVATLLMYPIALLFGRPLAQQRMDNLSNWLRTTVTALPLAELPPGSEGGAEAGARLSFGGRTQQELVTDLDTTSVAAPAALLVFGGHPLESDFAMDDGDVVLDGAVAGPLVVPGAFLEGPLEVQSGAGHLFRVPAAAESATATVADLSLYLGTTLLGRQSYPAIERADGVNTRFSFPPGAAEDDPVIVDGRLLMPVTDFSADGDTVDLAERPPFNATILRLTGDYEVVDAAAGVIALRVASDSPPRVADGVLALAETLVGPIDGVNRVFNLRHVPLVETDAGRRIMLDHLQLDATAQRPAERVDGTTSTFTFPGEPGMVLVDGVELVEGRDFTRAGQTVVFIRPPARNAALRQYRDYLVSDVATGEVTLSRAPDQGQRLWAGQYTFYDRPNCGSTVMECFYSLPQHPVPFPNWIAERIVPFFTAYPLSDSRSVVRAVLYTASGTLLALLFGSIVGVALAVVFVRIKPFEQALLPWVIASQTIPIIALVPVLLLLLGNAGVTVQTSLVPAALIGAYIAFFPVTVGTVTGLRSVDPLALDLMKGYAATPLQVFTKVRFPAAVPFFFTSLKLGAAAALVGALVAEVESNNRLGLGYAIIGQVQAGDVADVWILLGVSALLGIGLVGLVGLVQKVVAPWDRTAATLEAEGRGS